MSKRLVLTEKLKAKIRLAAGEDDIDFSKLALYESVAASTRAISQKRTAYDGAVMSESFLVEMADYLAKESVPMLIMHEGQMLPIGKVFDAGVLDADAGHKDLNALFYIEADSEYASKIDLGIIDEVSVGALPKHAYCSECDFDYMEEGNEMNFYFRECDNEHALGVDGTHLRLTGLSSWQELSLVGKGASDKPKIVGSTKQRLGKETYERIAASATNPTNVNMAYLLCSATLPEENDDEGNDMNLKEITDQVSSLSADKAKLELKHETATAELAASTEKVAALQDKVTNLETELAKFSDDKQSEEITALKASLEEKESLTAYFDEQVKLASVAAGLELKEDATLADKIELMKNAQVKLAAIPRGGQARPTETPDSSLSAMALTSRNSAFQTL